MDSLIFLAHGSTDVKQQTLFSICSALLSVDYKNINPSTFRSIIYTDDISYFSNFFGELPVIEYRQIDSAIIREWKGSDNFIHRVKLQVLKHHYRQSIGKLLYADGDTIFLAPVTDLFAKISSEISLMHCLEGRLNQNYNTVCKKIRRFLRGKKWSIGGELIEISDSIQMWNAGIIGITDKQAQALDLMIELTDKLYLSYKKHVMEQLAVSYLLQTRSAIVGTENEVLHYYLNKDKMQLAAEQLLSRYSRFSLIEVVWQNEIEKLQAVLSVPPEKKRKWYKLF